MRRVQEQVEARIVSSDAMPRLPTGPRTNRRGCFIILIMLAIVAAAIAYVGFHGKPVPEGKNIPVM